MKYVTPCPTNTRAIIAINSVTENMASFIEKTLTFKNVQEEAEVLNRVESFIPEDIKMQLELKLVLEGKASDYHRSLINGNNLLLEEASAHLPKGKLVKINESYGHIIDKFKNKLHEQAEAAISNNAPEGSTDVSAEIDKALTGGTAKSSDAQFLTIIKNFALALTEGGSVIGIIHLILDIIGVIGDIWYPVGLIADILNGLIYLVRGKWILAILSFIGAVIPFAGPILKNAFKISKVGSESIKITSKYFAKIGAKKATKTAITKISPEAVEFAAGNMSKGVKFADEGANIAGDVAAASPKTLGALEYISKTIKGALSKVAEWIGKFFKDFLGKAVGWIPFIGKPLKKVFDDLGELFMSFRKKAVKMADDLPSKITKAKLDHMDNFFNAASTPGTRIAKKGDDLVIMRGNEIVKIGGKEAKLTEDMLSPGFLSQRYGGKMTKDINEYITKNNMNIGTFYDEIFDAVNNNKKLYNKVNKIGKKIFIVNNKMVLFVGKQIVKYLSSTGFMRPLSDGETELFGSAAVHNIMKDLKKKNMKKNPNSIVDVPYVDNFSQPGSSKTFIKTLNDYAEMTNQPQIGMLSYAIARGSGSQIPEEMEEMWRTAYGDNVKPINTGELISKEEIKKTNESLKYIKPFKMK